MNDRFSLRLWLFVFSFSLIFSASGDRTRNGNVFSLGLSEAKTPESRQVLLDKYLKERAFFRYLKIEKLEKKVKENQPYIDVLSMEYSSGYSVILRVIEKKSLDRLSEMKVGNSVAVTGVITSVDLEKNMIYLDPVHIKHQDRDAPRKTKEGLHEVSYPSEEEATILRYQDRDLLKHKNRIIKEQGQKAWIEFLTVEIAKRNKARKAELVKVRNIKNEEQKKLEKE